MQIIPRTQKTFIANLFLVSFTLMFNFMVTKPANANSPEHTYEMSVSKSIFDRISGMGKSFLADYFQDADGYNNARADEKGELVVFYDAGDHIKVRVNEQSAQTWLALMDDFADSIFVDNDTRQVMEYMRAKFYAMHGSGAPQIQLAKYP